LAARHDPVALMGGEMPLYSNVIWANKRGTPHTEYPDKWPAWLWEI
jgi:hypothetical protein